jgi:ABC-2 type transport system ATP-binding protein
MMTKENNPPVASAVGLTKIFRDFWGRPKAKAVVDIDFNVYPGEVIGLLGPNGSGKSTTVKMLLGLLYPTAGTLSVLGRSPRAVDTKREIGYLPEESYLYKYLTASETLDFFGALFGLSAAERRLRTEQLLEMVGLSHAKRRRVGEFSKGMARRIGLAQAMINDPALLILDEPTSGLDPLGCKEVKDLILHLKKRGKTVIVTSHMLSDVEDICDRVMIMYGGKIRAEGTLNELLTITDASRITTPQLSPEVTAKVLKILRENFGSSEEFQVDHPRKSLEEFFLEVIASARRDSVETAGVVSGGQIAGYLNDDKDSLLQTLTKGEAVPEARPAIPEPAETSRAELEADNIRLKKLTAEAPAKAEPEPAAHQAAEKLAEANDKLKDLLSGK